MAVLKLTPEMKEYEKETGKKAIWRGEITESFKKWQRGEEVYGIDKKGVGVLVSEEIKNRWEEFVDHNEISTISKLIRKSVDFYIDVHTKQKIIKDINKIYHDLNEPLTIIQGFSRLILENYENIDAKVIEKIEEIHSQSVFLEKKLHELVTQSESGVSTYDVLIVEDNNTTIKVLEEVLEDKNLTCKGINQGIKTFEELARNTPKIILIDIILPDINGYELCKKIKESDTTKNIPVFFITAVPETEVIKKMKETGADGYFLKPFKFEEFKILKKYVDNSESKSHTKGMVT